MNPSSELLLDPPAELAGRILKRITRHEHRRRSLRLGLSLVTFFVSMVCLRVVLRWVSEDIAWSGFGEFVSLIFVDASIVTRSGQDFTLALLESLPALSMSLGGILIIIGFVSGWSLFRVGRLTLRVRQFSHE